jgi:hypothetical protein
MWWNTHITAREKEGIFPEERPSVGAGIHEGEDSKIHEQAFAMGFRWKSHEGWPWTCMLGGCATTPQRHAVSSATCTGKYVSGWDRPRVQHYTELSLLAQTTCTSDTRS